jgi:hypothetical protein
MGAMRNACAILIGKIEIGMDFREIGWEVVDGIHLTQDRDKWWALVNTVMNLWVP